MHWHKQTLVPLRAESLLLLLSVCSCLCCLHACAYTHRRKLLGLADHVKLLPESKADAQTAQLVLFQHSGSKFHEKHQDKRRKVMTESIFGAAGGGRSLSRPGAAAAAAVGGGLPSGKRRPLQAAAAAAAPSAKEQLQQRVLACKRKKLAQQA